MTSLKTVPIIALGLALTACETTPSSCPPLKDYTKAERQRAVREIEALPFDAFLRTMVDDYFLLRKQVRRCR